MFTSYLLIHILCKDKTYTKRFETNMSFTNVTILTHLLNQKQLRCLLTIVYCLLTDTNEFTKLDMSYTNQNILALTGHLM